MGMPKPTEEHARLARMAGEWVGTERMEPSAWVPEGAVAEGRVTNRMDLDGFVLIQDYVQERDGAVTYRGHGVLGYDPRSSRYCMYWFDSISGMPHGRAEGGFDGDVMQLSEQTPMGHSRTTWELVDEDHYRFRMELSRDGQAWNLVMSAEYRRA